MRKKLLWVLLVVGILAVLVGGYIYLLPSLNAENRQINAWIEANNLNEYGDPAGTAYSNKKPVDNFLPADRYEFIKKKNPDKPWAK